MYNSTHLVNDNTSDLSDEDDNVNDDYVDEQCDLIDVMEATDFADAYHYVYHATGTDELMCTQHPSSSSRKRQRNHVHDN